LLSLYNQFSEHLFSCKTETHYLLNNNFSFLPPLQFLSATILLCFCECDYSQCFIKVLSFVFSLLASFPEHNILKFQLCCSTLEFPNHWRQNNSTLHVCFCHIVFAFSSVNGHLVWFHLLTSVNSAAITVGVQRSLQDPAFDSLWV
jgi:hypothetical protein